MSDPGYPINQNKSLYYYSSWYSLIDSRIISELSVTTDYLSYGEDKVSVNTPGWPEVVRDNPYYHGHFRVTYTPSTWSGGFHDGSAVGGGTLPVNLYITAPGSLQSNVSDAVNRAKARVISKLQTQLKDQKFNAGVALGEARATANLVASTATKIAQAVRSLKRGNVRGAIRGLTGTSSRRRESRVRQAGSVPKQWLELQYGWRPLLSDVYGATEALRQSWSERPVVLNAKATVREVIQGSLPFIGDYGLKAIWTQDASVRVTGFIEYEVGDELAHLSSSTGIRNPLSVAWELVPYSFVVDWFIPVGTYLNNLDYAAGLAFRRGYISKKYVNKVTSSLVETTYTDSVVTMGHSGASRSERGEAFDREVMSSFPHVELPSLQNPLSLGHVANGLSLLASAFDRR